LGGRLHRFGRRRLRLHGLGRLRGGVGDRRCNHGFGLRGFGGLRGRGLGGGGGGRGGGLVGGRADRRGGGRGLGPGLQGGRLDVRYARGRIGLLAVLVGALDAFGIDRAAVFLAAATTTAAAAATLALGVGTRFGAGVHVGVDAGGILGHGSLLIAADG